MSSLFKRVLKGGAGKRSHSPPPVAPPSPDLSHLTQEEVNILSDVLKRQERFEQQEQERVRRLEEEMQAAEQAVKSSQPERNRKWRIASARLCRLCFKTRMSEGAGRTCSDCRKRVCGRCGSFSRLKTSSQKGVWLCKLCVMKREVTCRTGGWYHGARGHAYTRDTPMASTAADVLRRKLKDFNEAESTGSDQQTSGENKGHEDITGQGSNFASDSQLTGQGHSRRSQAPDCSTSSSFTTTTTSTRSSTRRRSLISGSGQAPLHRCHPQDPDDEDENIHDILLERKLSYRRRQQKRLRRRSVQNGQGKNGGAATSLVPDKEGDRNNSGLPATLKYPAFHSDSFVTIPLHTSPESLEEREEFPAGVQSTLTSPVSPERLSPFNVTRSAEQCNYCPRAGADGVDCSLPALLHKTASTRRRAFQQSSGSGGQKLSITVQKSSFSDEEGPRPFSHTPHSYHSGNEDGAWRLQHEGRSSSPRALLTESLASPDDRRLASSSDERSGAIGSRTPSPSSPRRFPVRRDVSPSAAKRIHRDRDNASPGNKRKAKNDSRVSPGDSLRMASSNKPGGSVSPSSSRRVASSEPSTPTGWKDTQFRCSLSPSSTRKAAKEEAEKINPSSSRKAVDRRHGADRSPRDSSTVTAAGRATRSRGSSLETPSSNKLRDRSYSEGNERADSNKIQLKKLEEDGEERHQQQQPPHAVQAKHPSQRNAEAASGVDLTSQSAGKTPASTLPQQQWSPHSKPRHMRRANTSASSPDPSSSSSPIPAASYSCATQALRRVKSPETNVTQLAENETITCRCMSTEGRFGRSSSPGVGGKEVVAGRRSTSPRDYLTVYEQDTWEDCEAHLIHTVLHKPPGSFPEAFGVHVTGGIIDVSGGLVTLIRDISSGSPAQLAGLQSGDQVVEWNGQSLGGATFERVMSIVSSTTSDAVHLFTLPKRLVGRAASPFRCSSRSSDVELRATTPPTPGHSASDSNLSSTIQKRRMLPRTPVEIGRESRQMNGELLLSVDYDPATAILYVTLVMARDLALPENKSHAGHRASDAQGAVPEPTSSKPHLQPSTEPAADSTRTGKGPDISMRDPPHVTVQKAETSSSGVEGAELDGASSAPSPFVLVYLLPDRRSRDVQKTEPRCHNRKPEWEQTFVYDNFTITELVARSLELTVWSRSDHSVGGTGGGTGGEGTEGGGGGRDEFLGEILLDLREWRQYSQPRWCKLHDHDDNSPSLPRPRHLYALDSVISSASSSCYDDLAARSPDHHHHQHSHQQQQHQQHGLSHSKDGGAHGLMDPGQPSPTPGSSSSVSREYHGSSSAQPDSLGHKLSRVTRGMVKSRLVSRVSSSFSHADRKGETASDESSPGDVTRQRSSISDTHGQGQEELRLMSPGLLRRTSTSYNMDLLAPPRPLSRANSSSSFFLSDDSSDGDPYSPSPVTPDRPAPDGDDITSILGPGQVPPRPSSETAVCGDIKLGFAVSKGQLEVDIICAKGLQRLVSVHPPDSYVKTYLVEGSKTIQKKKSQVVKASADPIFRRKIKYSACNVHGRHMRIVVWEKPRNFERKQSLGETVVRLDALDLSSHTMTWYKLFPVNSTDLGSTDSLSQW